MAIDNDSMSVPSRSKKKHHNEGSVSSASTSVSIDIRRSQKVANGKACKVTAKTPAQEEVDIDPANEESGFEALLRPLRDITLNWDLTIKKSLEMYINTLNSEKRKFSFAEAAMIVSNSTSVYCRRVDAVFKLIVDLVENLTKCSLGEDPTASQQGPGARRKPKKDLVNEDMTDIGFANYCNSVNHSVDKLESRMVEVKPVILNSSMKVLTKENTTCTIYQAKGVDLGYKNEFRLNWYKSSDGVLYEDFNNNCMGIELGWTDKSKISFAVSDMLDNLDDSMNDVEMGEPCIDQDLEIEPEAADSTFINKCAVPPVETNLLCTSQSPLANSPERIEEVVKEKEVESPPEDWAKAPSFNFKIPLLAFKTKKVFTLPAEIFKKAEQVKKRKRGIECQSYLTYLELVGKPAINTPLKNKVLNESGERKKLLADRKSSNVLKEAAAAKEFEEDFLGFNGIGDDDASEAEADPVDDPNDTENEGNPEENVLPVDLDGLRAPLDERLNREENMNVPTYEDDRQQIMMDYQQSKKEDATKSTEVAKRVAEWHESLQPILAKSEERSKFDVQVYGSKILDLFPKDEESPVKKFQDIVKGQPKEEICRYFLSSLMLANTYNVEIVRTNSEDLSKDCMELKLLSRVRHHEELDDNLRATSDAANLE